jgi:hypothetical protein
VRVEGGLGAAVGRGEAVVCAQVEEVQGGRVGCDEEGLGSEDVEECWSVDLVIAWSGVSPLPHVQIRLRCGLL